MQQHNLSETAAVTLSAEKAEEKTVARIGGRALVVEMRVKTSAVVAVAVF